MFVIKTSDYPLEFNKGKPIDEVSATTLKHKIVDSSQIRLSND